MLMKAIARVIAEKKKKGKQVEGQILNFGGISKGLITALTKGRILYIHTLILFFFLPPHPRPHFSNLFSLPPLSLLLIFEIVSFKFAVISSNSQKRSFSPYVLCFRGSDAGDCCAELTEEVGFSQARLCH